MHVETKEKPSVGVSLKVSEVSMVIDDPKFKSSLDTRRMLCAAMQLRDGSRSDGTGGVKYVSEIDPRWMPLCIPLYYLDGTVLGWSPGMQLQRKRDEKKREDWCLAEQLRRSRVEQYGPPPPRSTRRARVNRMLSPIEEEHAEEEHAAEEAASAALLDAEVEDRILADGENPAELAFHGSRARLLPRSPAVEDFYFNHVGRPDPETGDIINSVVGMSWVNIPVLSRFESGVGDRFVF